MRTVALLLNTGDLGPKWGLLYSYVMCFDGLTEAVYTLIAAGCRPGSMLSLGSCVPCPKDYYCLGGTTALSVATACGDGLTTINQGTADRADCGEFNYYISIKHAAPASNIEL
jgi:hypothetical protein